MHGLVQVTLLIFLLGLDKHLNRIEVVQEVLQGWVCYCCFIFCFLWNSEAP